MDSLMRLSAIAFPLATFEARTWVLQVQALVRNAVDNGAEVVVFPEYVAGGLLREDLAWESAGALWRQTMVAAAQEYQVWVMGGTHLERHADGWVNRALVIAPDGTVQHQDKLHPTPWEVRWQVAPTHQIHVFQIDGAACALPICYDIEFPEAIRAAAKAGAEVLLLPSWTEDEAGFHRVRGCARARCVENVLAVVHAPLVGRHLEAPGFEQAVGTAAILTPCDHGWPPAGVAAEGGWSSPGVVTADLDLDRLRAARTSGSVTPFADARAEAAYLIR